MNPFYFIQVPAPTANAKAFKVEVIHVVGLVNDLTVLCFARVLETGKIIHISSLYTDPFALSIYDEFGVNHGFTGEIHLVEDKILPSRSIQLNDAITALIIDNSVSARQVSMRPDDEHNHGIHDGLRFSYAESGEPISSIGNDPFTSALKALCDEFNASISSFLTKYEEVAFEFIIDGKAIVFYQFAS